MKRDNKIAKDWKIKCPYCFEDFLHNEVHFRISKDTCRIAEERWMKKMGNTISPFVNFTEDKVCSRFRRRGEEQIDPKYNRVWGNLRGGNPSDTLKELFYIPWVDQDNKIDMLIGDYRCDSDGFVNRIEDRYFHQLSNIRICPYCHNELPLNYGKNPQKFIAIIGVSSSGKTVFIRQLLSKIENCSDDACGILSHVGGKSTKPILMNGEKFLDTNEPLPDATDTLNFKIPYFATVRFEKNGDIKTYDFVIYDIAGETLVDLTVDNIDRFNFFGGYIKKSDAIIMLIDPMQLVNNPVPKYSANQMMSTLYNVFGSDQLQIPTAVTISKSDLLFSNELIREALNPNGLYFNENSPIRKNIPWDETKKYFYSDIYAQLSGQLHRFYQKKANIFFESVNKGIKERGFFAVSSLLNGVDIHLKFELSARNICNSEIIDRYISGFNILADKLKAIRRAVIAREANPYFEKAFTNISVSRTFVLSQNNDIVIDLDKIFSEIYHLNTIYDINNAVNNAFGENEVIELTEEGSGNIYNMTKNELISYIVYYKREMSDCKFDISICGYPSAKGNLKSLRIEEPFFWLLSKMEIINSGNLYNDNTRQRSGGFLSSIFGEGKS